MPELGGAKEESIVLGVGQKERARRRGKRAKREEMEKAA